MNYGNRVDDTDDNPNQITLANDLFGNMDSDDDDNQGDEEDDGRMRVVNPIDDTVSPQTKKSRFQLLSETEDYPFMKLVAGAMQVDTETLYEHEDVERVIQSDYDTQLATRRLLLEQENRVKKISLAETRSVELKKQLIGEHDTEIIEYTLGDNINNLEKLVSPTRGYRYENLCREYNDYELVLGSKSTPEALVSFMERLYLEGGVDNSFEKEFNDAKLGKDTLKEIAMIALWHRELDTNKKEKNKELPSLIDDDLIEDDVFRGQTEEVKAIKQESDGLRKAVYIVKPEQKTYFKGIHMASPTQSTRITAHHDYTSYMTALFNVAGDITARNELLRGVDLSSIHRPELNERIKSIKNSNIANVIDTTKAFFKEVYYMNSSPIEIYTDNKNSLGEYKKDLTEMKRVLTEARVIYENRIVTQLDDIANVILSDTEGGLSLLNRTKLQQYATKFIPNGILSRDMIMTLITDSSFREYYKENHRETGFIDKKMDSYLAMSMLFILLAQYIPKHNSEVLSKIAENEKIVEQLRDEQVNAIDPLASSGNRTNRTNATIPPPQVKPNVEDKIDEAYHLILKHCPNLKGLPLYAMKTKKAIASGIAGDFARYVAALFADANLLFPDVYKPTMAHIKVVQRKFDTMNRLKEYSYTRQYGSRARDEYRFFSK